MRGSCCKTVHHGLYFFWSKFWNRDGKMVKTNDRSGVQNCESEYRP